MLQNVSALSKTYICNTHKASALSNPYNLEGMDSRLQSLLAHTHLRRLLMCTINVYVDHINITDKDTATFTVDLVFSPHRLPTWPVNRNSIFRHCLIKYDFTEDTRVFCKQNFCNTLLLDPILSQGTLVSLSTFLIAAAPSSCGLEVQPLDF